MQKTNAHNLSVEKRLCALERILSKEFSSKIWHLLLFWDRSKKSTIKFILREIGRKGREREGATRFVQVQYDEHKNVEIKILDKM
jgi:hypothetical protein